MMLVKILTTKGKPQGQKLRVVVARSRCTGHGGTERQHNHVVGRVTRGCHDAHRAVG